MSEVLNVPTMAEMLAQGKQPEVLFWVGCAGSFDDRAKRITKAFVRILNRANVEFAVLGTEESCTVILQNVPETNFFFKCKP
jgi:heterodisulfide reductase subunit D